MILFFAIVVIRLSLQLYFRRFLIYLTALVAESVEAG